MVLKHLYGLLILLCLFVGIVALTLGSLAASRSKEKYLKYFLVVLSAFNLKFLLDLVWSYTILNVSGFPPVLFGVALIGSGVLDVVYLFFLILVWNSLFSLKLPRTAIAAAACVLSAAFLLIFVSGTYVPGEMIFKPGRLAGIGNTVYLLVFSGIIFTGFFQYRKIRTTKHRFFLCITLTCACVGFIQMTGALVGRLASLPLLEIRAPLPGEIGFPWLSVYFGLYMAALIFFFLKRYVAVHAVPEPAVSAVKGYGTISSALDAFCTRYDISAREQEILALVLEGHGNEDIGKRLFISTGTVKTHMHSIFRKTEARSRAILIRRILG